MSIDLGGRRRAFRVDRPGRRRPGRAEGGGHLLSARLFAVPLATAAETAILLSQAGEFGFVVFALARSNGILPAGVGQFLIVVVGLAWPSRRCWHA